MVCGDREAHTSVHPLFTRPVLVLLTHTALCIFKDLRLHSHLYPHAQPSNAHTQVSRLEQRIHAVTADNDALQSELDGARRDLDRTRDAAASASAGEGLARLPRDKWPLPVLMLVQAAEAAAVTDIAEKHVSLLWNLRAGAVRCPA